MARERNQNSTFDEIDKLLADEEFCRAVDALNDNKDITVHSSTQTTPDPLNTAFIEDTNLNEHQQSNLSQQQSQTINDASAILRELAEIATDHEHERIDQPLPTTTTTTTKGNLVEIVDLLSSTSRTIDLCTPTPTPTPTSTPTTIDLCTPTPATIDLCTPAPVTIDLDSPQIPSNTNTTDSPLHLSPK
ncbi:unnamed protein product [Rotaria sordida]|uniref:Uncharacterized protein n=1 Tax=Rotaria sordida TaxID=392033 RepID=A0A815RE54_9BILA|nr:unnamed protein product [Rotaria sordida]CAF1473957.1 unnamed protein product [Rotaria sordida]CAF1633080.1 unnamed protein product [Rotaria sordida]CAF4090765.1 unnamed protein product [Rotaria sordida]